MTEYTCRHCGKRFKRKTCPTAAYCNKTCYRAAVNAQAAARTEDVEWLLRQGESPWQIMIRLDSTASAICALVTGQGRPDLAVPFVAINHQLRKEAAA